ncbi:MAG: glycosyltransferase [Nanoarchaeota archaeon]|nr:glycosyltransferase [Nanoarchaeota archaeon]
METVSNFVRAHDIKIGLTKRIVSDWEQADFKELQANKRRLITLIEEIISNLAKLLEDRNENEILGMLLAEAKKPILPIDRFNFEVRANVGNFFPLLERLHNLNQKQYAILTSRQLYESRLVADLVEKGDLFYLFKLEHNLDRELKRYRMQIMRKIQDHFSLKDRPLISVILPAYNEEEAIRAALNSVTRQDYPKKEVIVVNNLSEDGTADLVKPYTYKHIFIGRKGVSVARNSGASAAGGEILIFLDSDSELGQGMLEKVYEELYQNNKIGGAARAVPDRPGLKPKMFFKLVELCKTITYAPSGIMWCTKESFKQLGGFREDYEVAEDAEFLGRLKQLGKSQGKKYLKIREPPVVMSCRRLDRRRFGYVRTFAGWGISYLYKPKRKTYKVIR